MGWFQHLSGFVSGTFIKSDPMNDKLDRIAASFDYLPAPRESGEKGFLGALAVGGATKQEHALSAGQFLMQAFITAIDSGTANNFVLSIPITVSAYIDGMAIAFKPAQVPTGACQGDINGLGNIPFKTANGSDLTDSDLDTNSYSFFKFNGTEFRAVSLLPGQADSIDESSSHFMRADIAAQGGIGADSASDTANWDSSAVAKSGCSHWMPRGIAPNGPGGTPYYYPFTFEYSTKDGTGNLTQFAIGYNANKLHMRYRLTGTWSSWTEFVTTDNFSATLNPYGDARYVQQSNFNTLGDARYLRLAGGNLTGTVQHLGHNAISSASSQTVFGDIGYASKIIGSNTRLETKNSSDATVQIEFGSYGFNSNESTFRPLQDNQCFLGSSSLAWKEVNSYNYVTASDERLKNIKDIGDTSWIYNLEPIAYEWKENPSGLRYGLSAQKTYDVMPDKTANLVNKPEKEEEPWGMAPDQLIAPLLAELKKLRKRVEQLEAR